MPEVMIVETCLVDEWKERECHWIAFYRSQCDLTNAKDGGDGLDPDASVRERMASAKRGKPSHNKGKQTPEDVRQKQRESAIRRWARMTDDERQSYIRSMKERRAPVTGQAALRGWRHTDEAKTKIAAANVRSRTITIEQARTVKALLEDGMKSAHIARDLGIKARIVYSIKYGQAYRDA